MGARSSVPRSPRNVSRPLSFVQRSPGYRVAVAPHTVLDTHSRLLNALARLFQVTFEPWNEESAERCVGAIVLGAPPSIPTALPMLVVHQEASEGRRGERIVAFGDSRSLPTCLRGRSLAEEMLAPVAVPVEPLDVLATAGGAPIWGRERTGTIDHTSVPLRELDPGETLRRRLRSGTFAALLPVVEFLRRLTGDVEDHPLRACFVFDDPNLHTTRYGYIRFAEIAADAADAGYHVSMATVPLDTWYASPRAVRIFRENAAALSLTVHGVNHIARELGRDRSPSAFRRSFVQALRRVERFERRYGLRVSRVMIAPHGTCSTTALQELLAVGFDGASLEWPYWWLDAAEDVFAGWEPADFSISELPLFSRHHLTSSLDDLVLRAYLRQPLIVYGHHADVADGLDRLRTVAELINRLGAARWSSLQEIAENNYVIRPNGDGGVELQMYSARARFDLPKGATTLTVRGAVAETQSASRSWVIESGAHAAEVREDEPIAVEDGTSLSIRTLGYGCIDRASIAPRPAGPWSIGRRALAEGRDRLAPRGAVSRAR